MNKLALHGGAPVIDRPLTPYRSVGAEESAAVQRVMQSGQLSGFIGSYDEGFWGGTEIQAFEAAWKKTFGVKHAISVNSNTSGLFASMGAVGVGPGDEVIVPPWTMSATAMAPIVYGGIPVFVDIEPDTFCLDPKKVAAAITPRTRAILAVNLFGHPAALSELRGLADKHKIWLIEDNAQGPLATEFGRQAGTVGHIGVYSLNYHKHFHTGEGGVCVTSDDALANRLMMIRNHGENAAEALNVRDLSNLFGFNYRMTEMSAAVGIEQLKKAEKLVERRVQLGTRLSEAVKSIPGIMAPVVRTECRHVYYVWVARFDEKVVGVSRDAFARALTAEGFPNCQGYVKPLYLLPIFQRRIGMGREGFPFNLSQRRYDKGLCPVVERMHEHETFEFSICSYELDESDFARMIEALHKVYAARESLRNEAAVR